MPLLLEEKYIIRIYLWSDYEDIPIQALISFIETKIGSPTEELILKQWEKHFQGDLFGVKLHRTLCKPYVITIDPETKKKILWIEPSPK